MKLGTKFDVLSRAIGESVSYRLNANGVQLVQMYHSVIAELEKVLIPLLTGITKDPSKMAKQSAVQIVSSINSSKEGNEKFDLMARLDTMTNGGKTTIQGSTFAFNENDKILQYLEKL